MIVLSKPILAVVVLGALLPSQERKPQRKPVTDLAECRKALARLGLRHGKAKVIAAAYRQERTTALLVRPLVSEGSLALRKEPACMVFRGAGKNRAVIRLTHANYEVFRPKRKTLERTPLPDKSLADALFQAFSPRLAELDKAFSITRAWRHDSTLEIELRPKGGPNPYLKDFTLVLDEKKHELRRISYRDAQNDRVELTLRNLRLDPKLPANTFDLTLPKGTRILVHRPR